MSQLDGLDFDSGDVYFCVEDALSLRGLEVSNFLLLF